MRTTILLDIDSSDLDLFTGAAAGTLSGKLADCLPLALHGSKIQTVATVEKNVVPIVSDVEYGSERHLTVECPDGWDDVKKICKKVLTRDGRQFAFTGWNSDRNVAFFRTGVKTAKIGK